MPIHVEEEGLKDLRDSVAKNGESYKKNLARLTVLIDEITSGDIKGDPADDLSAKYYAKENTFKLITKTIEEAEDYMGIQGTKFSTMLDNLKGKMK